MSHFYDASKFIQVKSSLRKVIKSSSLLTTLRVHKFSRALSSVSSASVLELDNKSYTISFNDVMAQTEFSDDNVKLIVQMSSSRDLSKIDSSALDIKRWLLAQRRLVSNDLEVNEFYSQLDSRLRVYLSSKFRLLSIEKLAFVIVE